jgi:hypothetical protein
VRQRFYNFRGDADYIEDCVNDESIDRETLELFQIIEDNMDCQGLCKPTHFWFFRPITDGQPTQTCAVALKESFDSSFGLVGWGILFTLFFVLILLFCSLGLCRSKKQEKIGY